FFQAEDGIRDRNVTGVQTCALPISERSGGLVCSADSPDDTSSILHPLFYSCDLGSGRASGRTLGNAAGAGERADRGRTGCQKKRSEERRVGKEGRGRERGGREEEKR